jgi:hypothetical protein
MPLLVGGDDAAFMTKVALILNPPPTKLPAKSSTSRE